VPYALEAQHAVSANTAGGTLATQIVPAGAVMAFDLAACPAGWTAYVPAQGRTIVGVNPTGTSDLSVRARGASFGEEAHALSVQEMPSHNHGGSTGLDGITVEGNLFADPGSPAGNGIPSYGQHSHSIPSQGGGAKHNNMQPSHVLLYCKKS
jgi:hypothetical protein